MLLLQHEKGYALFDALLGSFLIALALLVSGYHNQRGQQAADYAWYGQQALVIAEDIANRIRINANTTTSLGTSYTRSILWHSDNNVCQDCTPSQRVRQDGYEIAQSIARILPRGGAMVQTCDNNLCIFVWWQNDIPTANRCDQHCIKLTIQP